MKPKTPLTMRWRLTLACAVLALLLLSAFFYPTARGPDDALSFTDPAMDLPAEAPAPKEPAASALDPQQLSELLGQTVERRLDAQRQRDREAVEQDRHRQQQVWSAWREEVANQFAQQIQSQRDLEQRMLSLEHGLDRLRAALQEDAAVSESAPAFAFRGIEVWHGQVYALLEHDGRILPARQGDSRLGWRIRSIDRERSQILVSSGETELILEEQ